MGFLLETGKYNYKYIDGKYIREEVSGGLRMTEAFKKGLTFCKSRLSFKCVNCQEKKPKNTRYLGTNWERVCVDCAMELEK